MTPTPFFRLLQVPIDDKGAVLAERIAALNAAGTAEDAFTVEPADFSQIPGSPFAYWTPSSLRELFATLPPLQSAGRRVCFGLSTKDDTQFLRLAWEVASETIGHRWFRFVKGGPFSPHYCDVYLVLDWENDGERLKAFANKRTKELFGTASWSRWINNWDYYFRAGLTWPRRTNGFSVRALPSGCIFADKGPALFVQDDSPDNLLALSAILNSSLFNELVRLQLARTELAQSYEVGLIQSTPVPHLSCHDSARLAKLTLEAHDLQRERYTTGETTHAFLLPALVRQRGQPTLQAANAALEAAEAQRQARLAAIQSEIDGIVFDLYDLSEADRKAVQGDVGDAPGAAVADGVVEAEPEPEEEEDLVAAQDPAARVQDLLMWCVGVAFSRWDIRKALDPALLPALGGPFDALPRYAPGALQDWPNESDAYPLPLPADGILVDDPSHPSDIVARVRRVLALAWGERADAVEAEARDILGVKALRDYFRDPRRFFAYHIKRYSKSRRKAPIYWLLQSERRSYGVWLYYHRIGKLTLYTAGREYVDGKIALEKAILQDQRAALPTLTGAARAAREREIERQEKLVAEVTAFGRTLDAIALKNLPPDHNDGVLINIAPLHPLAPWPEARRMWEALEAGQYGWSTMSKQMGKG